MLDMTGQRVLVTGGAGFLGSNLSERLIEQGYVVFCVDNILQAGDEISSNCSIATSSN